MTANLLDFDLEGLAAFCEQLGEKRFRAVQLFRWIHQKGASRFDEMSDLAKSLREKLKAKAVVAPPKVVSDKLSDDGTRKFLIDVGNGNAVETVFIPEDDRGTLCISTQAGCALDCAFWDLEAKRAGLPVWQLAKLQEPKPLSVTYTLP